jgi:hypothetical protein
MNIPKIKRVKDPDEKYKPKKQIHPHLPNVQGYGGGSLLLMISPVKTGKSTIISNMLLSDEMYGQDYFDDVYILSNTIANDLTSRYLKDAFDVQDHYSDEFIDNIIERQKSFDKKDQPEIVNHLASRFRHYNIRLLLFSTQKFKGAVSPIIRGNATDVIVGSPFPNQRELLAIAESYADSFGGIENFLKIYKLSTPNRYDFLYLDLQENPPLAYHNFEKLIARGNEIINENNND